jgi:hypothetical protein
VLAQGGDVGHALGVGIAIGQLNTRTYGPASLAASFAPWLAVIALTLALLVAPYAPALLVGRWWSGEHAGPLRRLAIVLALTMLACAATAMIFSWRFFADEWSRAYVEERYLLYAVPLLPILAVGALAGLHREALDWRRSAVVVVGYALVIGAAYGTLLDGRLWRQHPFVSNAFSPPHLASLAPRGGWGGGLTFGVLAAMGLLTGIVAHAFPRSTIAVLAVGVLAMSALGGYRLTVGMDWVQGRAYHGRALARVLRDAKDGETPIWLDTSVADFPPRRIAARIIQFWDISHDRFAIQDEPRPPAGASGGLFVSHSGYTSPLERYRVFGREYGIYRVPVTFDAPLRITAFGPTGVAAGKPFNIQADGNSAAWVIAVGATESTIVELNGVPMRGGVDVKTGLMTFTVPESAYATPGEYPLVLRDDVTPRVSQPVRFVVR